MPIPYDDAGDNIVNEPEIMPESNCANCDPCSIIEYDCPGGAIKLKEMET